MLNSHPEVVSFHSFREDPNDPEVLFTPEKLVEWLKVMRNRSSVEIPTFQPSNSFGTIHTYWGSEPKEAFLSCGGTFTAILRDPIRRIHSLFSHHYLRDVRDFPDWRSRRVDYGGLLKNGEIGDSHDIAINDIRNPPFTEAENWFVGISWDVLESDLDIITNCKPKHVLKHEDLVGSVEGLKEGLSRILDTEVANDFPGVMELFNKPTNTHAGKFSAAEEIFDSWPDKFKKLFFFSVLAIGYDRLEKAYSEYGYAIPSTAESWLENHLRNAV